MKNMFKFLMVALTATAMMFSACNKDDDKNEEPSSSNEIIVGEIGMPKNNELIENDSFTATWAASKSNKSDATFQYEVFLSDDGGASWNSLGKYKTNNCQLNELEGDKLYQLKVKTYCTDASGNETSAETEPVSFVAYYKKGTIGASVLTENSITMEWGNLLPYDEVELTISECTCDGYKYIYGVEVEKVVVNDGYSYTFNNLKAEKGYAIKYSIVCKDYSKNIEGTYYAMAIDGEKYIHDGLFNKIKLIDIDGSKWTIEPITSEQNCFGERYFAVYTLAKNLAYGYRVAMDADMIELLKKAEFTDSDIEKHTTTEMDGFVEGSSSLLAYYYKNEFENYINPPYFMDKDNVYYYYFFSPNGNFMRVGPNIVNEKINPFYHHHFMYIKD